jgi:hypothetical protein
LKFKINRNMDRPSYRPKVDDIEDDIEFLADPNLFRKKGREGSRGALQRRHNDEVMTESSESQEEEGKQ